MAFASHSLHDLSNGIAELDCHVQQVRVLRLKFSIVAHIFPLCTCIILASTSAKMMYLGAVIHFVQEYHQCLISSPRGTQHCPKQYLEYQYPAVSIVSAILAELLVILLLVFIYSQRVARTGLWDMTIGLVQRACCHPHQVQVRSYSLQEISPIAFENSVFVQLSSAVDCVQLGEIKHKVDDERCVENDFTAGDVTSHT